ncbi:MAG TPA: Maf family nucleotide pyrophosphatase [Dongiaceae bacterium]|nr:Maf family nucleotide pyrophosphatase [Dongiaceae bacterium]
MSEPSRPALVLASASAFRRRLLEAAGVVFEVVPADVDEPAIRRRLEGGDPAHIATVLAEAKAEAVSRRLPQALVIGADQVLALGPEILGKPRDLADARRQLQQLRGKAHALPTAVALAQAGKIVWTHVEVPRLTMRAVSDAFLDRYLADCGEPICQIVGAYEIEGRGIQLFERIDGDIFTIIGLPLLPLLAELRTHGVIDA